MLKKTAFIDQLDRLVSFKTLPGDTKTNARALDFIQSLLHPSARVERLCNGSAEILLASNADTLSADYGYMVHVDVVAASDALFTLQQKDNLVFGRGVSDMKFSIPLGVALLNELIEKQLTPTFTLAVTTDEEVGGFEGAAYLANTLEWRPQTLLVPDGGDNLRLVSASKGVAQFRITTFGTSAHASRVWQGDNAIPKMARIINCIETKYRQNNAQESWKTTVNFGTIVGGISTNQVCDRATLQVDFRYPETDSFDRILSELQDIVAVIAPDAKIEAISSGSPIATDTSHSVVRRFMQVMERECGQAISVERNYGSSDARHFAPFDIPILMIKPKGGDIHMDTEWLDVDSTMQFYRGLRSFVVRQNAL